MFNPTETSNGDGLELKRRSDRMSDPQGHGEELDTLVYPFYDVNYVDVPGEVDFFGNIGTLPKPILMKQWYTDESGMESDRVISEMRNCVWAERYWKSFFRDIILKGRDWAYEQECRLILPGLSDNTLDKRQRILTYDFDILSGIIFGTKTLEADKIEIIETIRQKCRQSSRAKFAFYQAYFVPGTGAIDYFPIELPYS